MRDKLVIWLLAALVLFSGTVRFFGFDDAGWFVIFLKALIVVVVLSAGILALRYFGLRSLHSKIVMLLMGAVLLWKIGDVLWWLFDYPLVSVADVFFLAGYPLVLIAGIFAVRVVEPDFFGQWKRVLASVLVCFGMIGLYLKFVPFAWDSSQGIIVNVVTSGYVIADLIVIIPLVFLLFSLHSGLFLLPVLVLSASLGLLVVADALYAMDYESYSLGFVDSLFDLSYACIGLFFVLLKGASETILKKTVLASSAGKKARRKSGR